MRATVVSFGFKYGIPVDADMVVDMRFLPNPHWDPELRPKNGLDEEVRDYVLGQPAAAEFLDRLEALLETIYAGFLAERKHYLNLAVGLHRREAPQRRDGRGRRGADDASAASRPWWSTATWVANDRRRSRDDPWAEVTDAGEQRTGRHRAGRRARAGRDAARAAHVLLPTSRPSSRSPTTAGRPGRLRAELGVLPPGDLRQALAALCRDDEWGRTWASVLQHRFASAGELHDHAVGNLLIVALWELLGGHVEGLDWVGPAARRPGSGAADGRRTARHRGPGPRRRPEPAGRGVDRVRGRSRSPRPPGRVESVELVPSRSAGLSRGARGHRVRRLGGIGARLVVHQCASAPAGAGAARRPRQEPSQALRDA